MKIIATIRVTTDNGTQQELLTIPDSSLTKGGKPIFLPDITHRYAIYAGVALHTGKVGKKIAPRFAHRYIENISTGILLVDLTQLEQQRIQGLPWERACTFDGAVAIGRTMDVSPEEIDAFAYTLQVADRALEWRIHNNAPEWHNDLSRSSQYYTIKMGDIILTGLIGPFAVTPDTHIKATNDNKILIEYNIK